MKYKKNKKKHKEYNNRRLGSTHGQMLRNTKNTQIKNEGITNIKNTTTGVWEQYKGKCYLWSKEKMNWTNAELACRYY